MIVHRFAQRSEEWYRIRAGRLCGSRAGDMLAALKKGSGEAAGRRNLRAQLVLERLTGRPQESPYQSRAMLDGIAREADAAGFYEAITGELLEPIGFCAHEELLAGCSPDGVIGDGEGIVEIKSPLPATHLDYLRTGTVPGDYQAQVLHNLWITGARWCDWLSFHPEFPERLRVKLVRIERDETRIGDYDQKARAFLAEVDRELEALHTILNPAGQLQAALEATL